MTLKTNDDGSLTRYVQADTPEEGKRSNWLPAPKGRLLTLHPVLLAKGCDHRRKMDAPVGRADQVRGSNSTKAI